MRKLNLYLDTSVLNFALAEEPSLALHQKATQYLLKEIEEEKHEAFISELVLAEINKAPKDKAESLKRLLNKLPLELLALNQAVKELADK